MLQEREPHPHTAQTEILNSVEGGLGKAGSITRKLQDSFQLMQKPHLPSLKIRPQRLAGSAFLNSESMGHPPLLKNTDLEPHLLTKLPE